LYVYAAEDRSDSHLRGSKRFKTTTARATGPYHNLHCQANKKSVSKDALICCFLCEMPVGSSEKSELRRLMSINVI
jgi:hypothetical protein